jgi:hypothetical protein
LQISAEKSCIFFLFFLELFPWRPVFCVKTYDFRGKKLQKSGKKMNIRSKLHMLQKKDYVSHAVVYATFFRQKIAENFQTLAINRKGWRTARRMDIGGEN